MNVLENNLFNDPDSEETNEWLEALASVITNQGPERAHFLIEKLVDYARRNNINMPYKATTAYVNSIHPDDEIKFPGDPHMERRIRAYVRWNALAMVVRANMADSSLGGHIGTYSSCATLYEIGFNHFWRSNIAKDCGDLIYFQGHASPGFYARSYLEGNLSEEQLNGFRREVDGKGLSSYPHPWLMPSYWQFPTVSMGLGPLQAIYQARFLRYLSNRKIIPENSRKVWCFCGDGEMDEPESTGGISLAARENLDNLIFVINCNLQRLDGPVRGNGKVIQELEGLFRGAGWNVIKVIWGRGWDPLLAKDKDNILLKRMEEAVDGDYQNYKAKGGDYTRKHFFGKYPELEKMVANLTDEDIWRLKRGGHDMYKVYAAYAKASIANGKPTVILAKTVKGYGLGEAGEAQNIAHNVKKVSLDHIKAFRDRFHIPIDDEAIKDIPFVKPKPDSPEMQYLKQRREELGGQVPARRRETKKLTVPALDTFNSHFSGTADREISTTMAFVRIITALTKDKNVGNRVVPIIPDEARTFGMEGMFRQLGIYSAQGQLYKPVDSDQVMFYKEAKDGQILEEGINEAGAFCSWLAAATSYSTNNEPMIPFYIYYSMFGFQRIGDLAWAAGDCSARGFLIGGTAGRTTLNGEGLQHQDGHSHILANTIPNCVTYDPTFNFELAVIIQNGMVRMYENCENVFYYITTMNENYVHPEMPKGAENGIVKGIYKLISSDEKAKLKVELLGSGTILREAIKAKELLEKDFAISADVYSVTSFNNLSRDGLDVVRKNNLNPDKEALKPYVTTVLDKELPTIAATDYMKSYADSIRAFVPGDYIVLGTDGFGRSDSREKLRNFFEVDKNYIAYHAVLALFKQGKVDNKDLSKAKDLYNIDSDKPNPISV